MIFLWHGLGDSAENMARALDVEGFVADHDAVVFVPDSKDRYLNTWDLISPGGADLTLYDDLRTCVITELGIDPARITSTGFSYGALWTTFLTIERGDTFAATMPMSGGTDASLLPYDTPANAMPVLVMWGGENDVFDAGILRVDFQETSLDFSSKLQSDGHLVVECDHGGGHTVPMGIHDIMADWLLEHTYGEPSPWSSGIDGFPSWCTVP